MKDLTRDEARERAELLHVTSYDVVLDVTGGEEGFDSTSTVAAVPHRTRIRNHLHPSSHARGGESGQNRPGPPGLGGGGGPA